MRIAPAPAAMACAAKSAPCARAPGSAANRSPGRTEPARRVAPVTVCGPAAGSSRGAGGRCPRCAGQLGTGEPPEQRDVDRAHLRGALRQRLERTRHVTRPRPVADHATRPAVVRGSTGAPGAGGGCGVEVGHRAGDYRPARAAPPPGRTPPTAHGGGRGGRRTDDRHPAVRPAGYGHPAQVPARWAGRRAGRTAARPTPVRVGSGRDRPTQPDRTRPRRHLICRVCTGAGVVCTGTASRWAR